MIRRVVRLRHLSSPIPTFSTIPGLVPSPAMPYNYMALHASGANRFRPDVCSVSGVPWLVSGPRKKLTANLQLPKIPL